MNALLLQSARWFRSYLFSFSCGTVIQLINFKKKETSIDRCRFTIILGPYYTRVWVVRAPILLHFGQCLTGKLPGPLASYCCGKVRPGRSLYSGSVSVCGFFALGTSLEELWGANVFSSLMTSRPGGH